VITGPVSGTLFVTGYGYVAFVALKERLSYAKSVA
jgi:hypothetical protein